GAHHVFHNMTSGKIAEILEPVLTALEDSEPSLEVPLAADIALKALTTGGIFLGGGICPKILPKLKAAIFMESFSNKGKFKSLLETVPVTVILNDKAALIGAAYIATKASEMI
ncbi:MAG: glucokinase, partial [Pseudomonadota bacterium]